MTEKKNVQHEQSAWKSWRVTSLVLVVVGLLVIALTTRKEPEFEGKTARQWARELPVIGVAREASPPLRALLKLGPAGFTEAAKLLRPGASLLEEFSEWAHPKSPGWLQKFLPPRPVSSETRARLAETLGHSGMLAAGQIPALGRALSDPVPKVREEAAIALWRFGPLATNATEPLLRALGDPDASVRSHAALALGEAKPPMLAMPALIGLLSSPRTCSNGARALGALGSAGSNAQPHLITRLRDSYQDFKPTSGIPVLADDARDQEMHCRIRLVEAIGKIGTDAERAVPVLAVALGDTNSFVHTAAAVALGKFGPCPAARDVLPSLIGLLDRLDGGNLSRTRAEATLAVWKVDPSQEPRLVKTLLQSLFDFRTAQLFAEMGSAARSVLPTLQADLRNGALNLQVNRAVTIWKITGETNGVLEVVVDAARNPTNTFPPYAVYQWCQMQPESREPMAVLINLAESKEARIREASLQYFARLGPAARPALPIVKQWLEDPNSSMRGSSGKAWLAIAPEEVTALIAR